MPRRLSTFSVGETVTPFDRHLLDVYEGRTPDGLAFFEAHGYFDVCDTANTVQMFRENVGLDAFWDDREDLDTFDPFQRATVYPFGSKSKVPSSRMRNELHRTNSGRFTLLDDDGNPVTEDDLLEMEREDRLKVKSLELDDEDVAELENELVCLKEANEVIRVEKYHLQRVFFRALYSEDADKSSVDLEDRYSFPMFVDLPPLPPPVALLDLPPYSGNLFVLRESVALLRRSWSKRWCTLDFQAFIVRMYKRSYWRSPRGEIDLRSASKIEMMGHGGFRIELKGSNMLLLRSRNEREAASWVQLLRIAMQIMWSNATRCPEISRLTNG
ncbi:uncharacterized protein PITG_17327 [Phytophthora infestans T30-4]|uniref:PH domain-containing protein n=2 Tax=Phytophthora infestans TaxID=4787 RepID=D0NVT5_PHYIT|nr:uncharacterized protein PITG_17327 [Phytophthora infestans T30-4]EEY66766.1 conserved hypothetical protein [Phytophthora infestans T30-4]KAF4131377.1 PH domain-containing protein [Phytophthora infestans]KAF4147131.1 PH domain-containing protein [Phytophthora infestans]KAI9996680.1 hypothetical protein PInf_014422 [Phytophthora infestans]|eukprot:XP_002896831.1 conserved hypothetical protein [Phytophthora infestans T30-4]